MIVSHSFKECLQLISIIYSNLENEKKKKFFLNKFTNPSKLKPLDGFKPSSEASQCLVRMF